MKTTRKILPALAMLLVSAIMLSTASFAWFASNNNVTASGMNIKVKSNAHYLQISKDSENDFDSSIKYELPETTKEIFLVHPQFDGASDATIGTLNWYLGTSSDDNVVGTTNSTPLDGSSNLDEYVLANTMYVRLAPGSTNDLSNLKIGEVTVTAEDGTLNNPLSDALRVLIVATSLDDTITYGAQIFDHATTGEKSTYFNTRRDSCLIPTVEYAGNPVYKLTVYIYYDGEDETAVTANTATLEDLLVSFKLVTG